ncbi:hypothetical protein M011DRAFT_115865 [Sporormia fimetaria CBS 119925]|uniref:Uncharacterized protein n=1 Tax=Sporormia fimetaria CBS 119925 TaxID=1340428 RepID=A0A6A6VMW5_9PLEO|nr:hypothetical protein M011DRAFT_115865 [Sporormia fimetaria CBS 119925]
MRKKNRHGALSYRRVTQENSASRASVLSSGEVTCPISSPGGGRVTSGCRNRRPRAAIKRRSKGQYGCWKSLPPKKTPAMVQPLRHFTPFWTPATWAFKAGRENEAEGSGRSVCAASARWLCRASVHVFPPPSLGSSCWYEEARCAIIAS